MRTSLPIIVGLLVAFVVVIAGIRRRQRKRDVPELNKHPERLDQMLDKSDDA